jgi:hypothetical protein
VLERSTTTDGKKDGILYVSKYQLLKSAETGLKSILERDKRGGKSCNVWRKLRMYVSALAVDLRKNKN